MKVSNARNQELTEEDHKFLDMFVADTETSTGPNCGLYISSRELCKELKKLFEGIKKVKMKDVNKYRSRLDPENTGRIEFSQLLRLGNFHAHCILAKPSNNHFLEMFSSKSVNCCENYCYLRLCAQCVDSTSFLFKVADEVESEEKKKRAR